MSGDGPQQERDSDVIGLRTFGGEELIAEDAATGFDEAGISVRRWSSSSHVWFTGSPSNAMLAATLAGICAQACSRRFPGGSACHACMFASQSIGLTLRPAWVSFKESVPRDDTRREALAKAERSQTSERRSSRRRRPSN